MSKDYTGVLQNIINDELEGRCLSLIHILAERRKQRPKQQSIPSKQKRPTWRNRRRKKPLYRSLPNNFLDFKTARC